MEFRKSLLIVALAIGLTGCGEGNEALNLNLFGIQSAQAASFDCTKATTMVEKRICANAEISELDELLGRFYQGATTVLNQPACLKQDQRAWLKTVRNRCNDDACLAGAYKLRLSTLSQLQPGAALPKQLELPQAPALLWIIPPAQDQMATPELKSEKIEVQGTLSYDLDNGGFVLAADDGRTITLIPDMLIEGATAQRLGVLQEKKTQLLVQGLAAKPAGEGWLFDNRACINLYGL